MFNFVPLISHPCMAMFFCLVTVVFLLSAQNGPPNPPSYFASVRGTGFRSRTESDRSAVIMFNSSQTDLPPVLRIENEGWIFFVHPISFTFMHINLQIYRSIRFLTVNCTIMSPFRLFLISQRFFSAVVKIINNPNLSGLFEQMKGLCLHDDAISIHLLLVKHRYKCSTTHFRC